MQTLPPITVLTAWRGEIDQANKMCSNHFYIPTDHGFYDLDSIRALIKLLEAKEIKDAVRQEIEWFSSEILLPKGVSKLPATHINNFRSLMHNSPMKEEMTSLSTVPNELARVCCKRFLSGDHMHFFIDKLNAQSSETFCIYLNRVTNVQRLKKFGQKRRLIFVGNIGKNIDGSTYLGSYDRQGCHWVNCVYDYEKNSALYGDSLGWEAGEDLKKKIKEIVDVFYPEKRKECNFQNLHNVDHTDRNGNRFCGISCTGYPLQTCYNICGVISVIMISIASLRIDLYHQIILPYWLLSNFIVILLFRKCVDVKKVRKVWYCESCIIELKEKK